ncbi:hypothetical protein ACIP29_37525 [Streptomyces coelicoflavus]|uniref:hypothetical protein n=1 Tax=Bacteria TaxID=2 RepID=UPI00380FE3EF
MRFHISRDDRDRNDNTDTDTSASGIDLSGATVNGGVFGGVNTGIRGGVFHGRIVVDTDDE